MESQVSVCPLKKNEDKTNPDAAGDDDPLTPPDRGEAACHEQRETVADGERGEEATRLPVGEMEIFLN